MKYYLITTYSDMAMQNDAPTYKTVAIDCDPAEFVIMQLNAFGIENHVVWSQEINEHQYNAAWKIWTRE